MSEPIHRELEDVVLELIAGNDRKWGWYQLDRELSARGILGIHVPTVVEALTGEGLLAIEGDPARAASRLKITQAGLARLARRGS